MNIRHPIAAALIAIGSTAALAPAQAQTAGSTTLGTTEIKAVADGWSVKKQFIGATVYNEEQKKVGKVEDVIVAPDGTLSYAIVGAGGFVGLGRHDVAIPVSQLKVQNDKMVLPGATKDTVKALPEFKYASKSERRL